MPCQHKLQIALYTTLHEFWWFCLQCGLPIQALDAYVLDFTSPHPLGLKRQENAL